MVATPLELSCAVPSNALPVQGRMVALQKLIVPGCTGCPAPITVAIRVTTVPGTMIVAGAPLAVRESTVVVGEIAGVTL